LAQSEKPVVYEQKTTGLEGFLLTMHKSRLVICHGKFHTGSPPQVVKYYQGTTIEPLQQNDNSNYSPMGL
jgi:hypothetical protein